MAAKKKEIQPPTKRWDWTSPGGRGKLDASALKVLAQIPDICYPRGVVANHLGIGDSENALKAVTRSLGRLEAKGWAEKVGGGPKTTFHITAAGKKEASK